MMQNTSQEKDAVKENPYRSIVDLPSELRNEIYHESGLFYFSDINAKRQTLTIKAYQIRYQALLAVICVDSRIAADVRPMILGRDTLHLQTHAALNSKGFKGSNGT